MINILAIADKDTKYLKNRNDFYLKRTITKKNRQKDCLLLPALSLQLCINRIPKLYRVGNVAEHIGCSSRSQKDCSEPKQPTDKFLIDT